MSVGHNLWQQQLDTCWNTAEQAISHGCICSWARHLQWGGGGGGAGVIEHGRVWVWGVGGGGGAGVVEYGMLLCQASHSPTCCCHFTL